MKSQRNVSTTIGKICVCFLMLFACACGVPASESESEPEHQLSKEEERILQQINYFSWIINRIDTTKNPLVLEEIYDQINDNGILLDKIPDEEIKELCKAMMDHIKDMRLDDMNRKFWKEIRDLDKKNALWGACPNPVSYLSPDWKAVTLNICSTLFAGFFQYKAIEAQIEREYKIKMHELDEEKIKDLNEFISKIFACYWKLVKDYKLNDKLRTSRNDCKRLYEMVNVNAGYGIADEKNTYDYLLQYEKTFSYLSEYWYYRGVFAEKNNQLDEAEKAYKYYISHHHRFLRKDKTAADVALRLIRLYSKNTEKNKQEIKKLLSEYVLENITDEDYEFNICCGLIYLDVLNEPAKAIAPLKKAAIHLKEDFKNRYNQFIKNFAEDSKLYLEDIIDPDNAAKYRDCYPDCKTLSFCRITLMRALCSAGKIEEAYEDYKEAISHKNIAGVEAYQVFQNTKPNQIPVELIADLSCYSIIQRDDDDDYDVFLPLSWFINVPMLTKNYSTASQINVRMLFCNADNKIIESVVEYKPLKYRYITLFKYPFAEIAKPLDDSEVEDIIKNKCLVEARPMMHLHFASPKDYDDMQKEGLKYIYLEISYDKTSMQHDFSRFQHTPFCLQLRYTGNQSPLLLKSGKSLDGFPSITTKDGVFGISITKLKEAIKMISDGKLKYPADSEYPLENEDVPYLPVSFSFSDAHPYRNTYSPLVIPEKKAEVNVKKEIRNFYQQKGSK